jgi:hypothetical protein
MLHKVIKLMRWERCIVVVGGNGTVNGALRYAPVEFNYENYKRDFEKPSPKEVLL